MTAVRARIFEVTQAEFGRVVHSHLRLAYSDNKAPVKAIARVADVPLPTARNWWDGKVVPQALHLERLRSQMPGLDAAIRKLHALEAEHSPDAQKMLHAIINAAQKELAR